MQGIEVTGRRASGAGAAIVGGRGVLVLMAALCVGSLAVAGWAVAEDHLASEAPAAAWRQWGGPGQDFRAPAGELASTWPETGPERLWSRELGDGYSAILFEDERLYTMHRVDDLEAVVCLDAATGETVWEHRYEVNYPWLAGYGIGPRATPVLSGDTLFTVGATGRMLALDKESGDVLWTRDLFDDGFDGKVLGHGYSSSPVAWQDLVIVPVGGSERGLVAFDQGDGSVRWRSLSLDNSYSSPRIVELAGETQLLAFMAEELVAVDPATGELRWRYEHANQWGHNISMPIVLDDDTIFLSSPQIGARGLRVRRAGDAFEVEEVWASRRVQLYHASSVAEGDWVYGSTGVTSTTFMVAVNARTGELGWKKRGFAKANCIAADGRLVILGEDGTLYLASATPDDLVVHAEANLLDRVAWTVPTIVDQTLYVRDRRQILAVDLGSPEDDSA